MAAPLIHAEVKRSLELKGIEVEDGPITVVSPQDVAALVRRARVRPLVALYVSGPLIMQHSSDLTTVRESYSVEVRVIGSSMRDDYEAYENAYRIVEKIRNILHGKYFEPTEERSGGYLRLFGEIVEEAREEKLSIIKLTFYIDWYRRVLQ